MSSLSSVFNSCSTLFTIDIYKKLRPDSSEHRLVNVGRIATGIVVISGILWIPFMKVISGTLYHYLQSVQSYIAPPIAATFLLGLFWKRINSRGVVATLITGFVLGMPRIVLELGKDSLSGFLFWVADLNFLYFALLLFLFSVGLMIVISILTTPPDYDRINGLTYQTTVGADRAKSRASWNRQDIVLSLVIVIIIIGILFYFSTLGIAG